MFRSSKRLSSRALIALAFGSATLTAAGAATYHRLAVVQTTGSAGSTEFLQNGTGSALQGEVAPSANTSITYPFGVLGEFDPSGSTFGIGTLGVSTTGYGLAGESTSSQPSILAFPGGPGIGLEATNTGTSGSPAILGVSKGAGSGVQGTMTVAGGYYTQYIAGVTGEDTSSPPPSNYDTSAGVTGTSLHGATGVFAEGDGSASNGVTSYSESADAVEATSFGTIGVDAINGGSSGDAIDSDSANGLAIDGTAGNSNAAGFTNDASYFSTLQLYNGGTGPLIDAGTQNGYFDVENNGTIETSGSLDDEAASHQLTQNPNSDVMSYGEEATQPTIEDVGSAHLINGSATVSLASDYRQTIDGSGYMVFLTPNGQSHGLYVASKSPTGFIVRENDGGRSTLAFDYRIVAQQYGAHDGRLPHFASIHPDITKQRLAAMRSDGLKRYRASRAKLAAAKAQHAIVRAAMLHRYIPQPLGPNPLGVTFSKR